MTDKEMDSDSLNLPEMPGIQDLSKPLDLGETSHRNLEIESRINYLAANSENRIPASVEAARKVILKELKDNEKYKLVHPIGGLKHPPEILSKEEMEESLSKDLRSEEKIKDSSSVPRNTSLSFAETVREIANSVPPQKEGIHTSFSRDPKLRYAAYLRVLLIFAGLLFAMSSWIGGGRIADVLSDPIETTVANKKVNGEQQCLYKYKEPGVKKKKAFVSGDSCYSIAGEKVTVWTNEDKSRYSLESPWRIRLFNAGLIIGSGMFFFTILYWALSLRRKVKLEKML